MSTTNWVDALSADELPTDDVTALAVAGRDIAIFTVGVALYATDNLRTHGHARLCDGFLDGHASEGRGGCEPCAAGAGQAIVPASVRCRPQCGAAEATLVTWELARDAMAR